jgi:hypothetical protein
MSNKAAGDFSLSVGDSRRVAADEVATKHRGGGAPTYRGGFGDRMSQRDFGKRSPSTAGSRPYVYEIMALEPER